MTKRAATSATKPDHKRGYFPVPPIDTQIDMRAEMALTLEKLGITVEVFHHEVATAGQGELSMVFNPLMTMADSDHVVQVRGQERRAQVGQDGDLHAEAHLRRQRIGHALPPVDLEGREEPLRRRQVRRSFRDRALLHRRHPQARARHSRHHQPGLNSYRRLVPGFEAPVNLAYSSRNRSASVRIPVGGTRPRPSASSSAARTRPPIRTWPSPPCSWRASTASRTRSSRASPLDKDIYALSPEELKDIPKAPGSLEEALENLKKDHAFLLKGDVFTKEVIDTWIWWKEENEIKPSRLRPTAFEFMQYFDA